MRRLLLIGLAQMFFVPKTMFFITYYFLAYANGKGHGIVCGDICGVITHLSLRPQQQNYIYIYIYIPTEESAGWNASGFPDCCSPGHYFILFFKNL